ncbi:MAG: 50S ribosomal protein L20 [Mycoplasmataceae bacterium]|nr:MAG: 50S ribosomal protein L20 [Mycoplasmataceae bacterium]
MTRASNTPVTKRRRKKILKQAKGYFGSKHKLFKTAKEQLMNSYFYSYRDRKQKKRDFRRLWILRINNACREIGLTYSNFIRLLNLSQIKINRKQLSEMCVNQPESFSTLISQVKKASQILNNNTTPSISAA